jgi:hypothetical protein
VVRRGTGTIGGVVSLVIAFERLRVETPAMSRLRIDRRSSLLIGGLVALLAIAVPAIAADPGPSGGPPGQTKEKPDKAGKPDKAAKGPELAKTIRGTVERSTDAKGRPTFTITVDGVTWELSAGPKWFYGEDSPLAGHVGKSVEVAGTYHEGETELDVETVDGAAIREPGRPPWAGGPREVGERHPGWKAWKADGGPGNGHGRENAPGQLKDKTGDDADD